MCDHTATLQALFAISQPETLFSSNKKDCSMKNYFVSFAFIFLLSSLGHGEATFSAKYSPEKSPKVFLMRNENSYLRKAAPDFWTLIPYAEGMRTGHSASAASMATVLNGLRKDRRYSSSDEMITEEGLLKKVKIENWALATSDTARVELTLKQM